MPPKIINKNGTGYLGDPIKKTKTKVVPFDNVAFLNMVKERDRLFWKEGKYREFLKKRYGL